MLTKKIKYTNFNGVEVEKAFYFNITKAELAMRELESDGTWSETLKNIENSSQGSVVMPEFKKIIKWTYGEKSQDGESFEKSDAIWAKFENSEAWSNLIMELLTDAGYAAEFINAVLPADIAAKNREAQATNGFRPGANTERPAVPQSMPRIDQNTPAPQADDSNVERQMTQEELIANGYPANFHDQGIVRTSTPTDQGSAGAQQGGIEQAQQ